MIKIKAVIQDTGFAYVVKQPGLNGKVFKAFHTLDKTAPYYKNKKLARKMASELYREIQWKG